MKTAAARRARAPAPEKVHAVKASKPFFTRTSAKNGEAAQTGETSPVPILRLVHSSAANSPAQTHESDNAIRSLRVNEPADAEAAPEKASFPQQPNREAKSSLRMQPDLAAPTDRTEAQAEKPAVGAGLEAEQQPPSVFSGAAPPAVDLQLPPPVPAGPAERVAEIRAADLSGSSDAALTRFIDATPSVMAASLPALAPAVSEKMEAEQQAFSAAAPALAVHTAGAATAAVVPSSEVSTAQAIELDDGVREADPGPLPVPPASAPRAFDGNAAGRKALAEENSGSIWDRFIAFLGKLIGGLPTRDDGVDTSAGPRPTLALRGEANPGRSEASKEQASDALQQQHDAHVRDFRDNPGQTRIQPRGLDEQCPVASAAQDAIEIPPQADEAVASYASAPLPQDVRDGADTRLRTALTPNLAEARSQTVEAARTHDSERNQEIATAQAAAARANADADAAQRKLVVDSRKQVAQLQAQGVAEADAQADAFQSETTREQGEVRATIVEHAADEEAKAASGLLKAEEDAEHERLQSERSAATKKDELERAQDSASWWDRTTQFIKKAVSAVTAAIDGIFNALRKAVATIIDKARKAAIAVINAARAWVVAKLDRFRVWLKEKTNQYLQKTFPELARRISAGIDMVADGAIQAVNDIADTTIESVNALADELGAELDNLLGKFQTGLKAAVQIAGAVMQGDFAGALRIAFEAACELAGVSPAQVFEFFDRAGQAVLVILKDPVAFIGKLLSATGTGIRNFFGKIGQHLISGVIGWLTGALAETPLTGPFEFSARGVLSIVLQVLGLTYANIKARVIRKLPQAEPVFNLVEKGYALLQRVLIEGPVALWNELKERLSNLKETVLGAIRNWLSLTAIKEGVVWLLSLTNPASALVKAVKLVFDLVIFLNERYQQIKKFVLSVYAAVNDILTDNFTKVSLAVENALARALPVLISLFASVLGLGNIAKQVTNVISKLTAPVNRAIDWVIDQIVVFAKKVLSMARRGAAAVRDTARRFLQWWKTRSEFRDASGEPHTLSYRGAEASAHLYVASKDPRRIGAFLKGCMENARKDGRKYTKAQVQAASAFYQKEVKPLEVQLIAADSGTKGERENRDVDAHHELADTLQKNLNTLGENWLRHFFDPGNETDFPPPQLPVMANNVKARSFKADYIVNDEKSRYRYAIKTGTESGAHAGNLAGWSELQGAKLTVGAQYVRMHLLPHRLGGNAVDSNLTPAPGSRANTPFSSAVEQPAIQAAVEGDVSARKPIWYDFSIEYHKKDEDAPASWPVGQFFPSEAFPELLHATWGFYKERAADSTGIERNTPSGQKIQKLDLPDLSFTPSINVDGETALHAAIQNAYPAVTTYFIREILLKDRKEEGLFKSKTNMKKRLWMKRSELHGSKRQEYVTAVYEAISRGLVTLDA